MTTSRRSFLHSLGAGAAALLPTPAQPPERKPNVVFILADDLGGRDTTPYGATWFETPNIARLASRGMRFTSAYAAAPICSPTRASILTGLYPARIGITVPVCHVPQVVLEQKVVDKAPPTQKALHCNSVTRLKQEYSTLAESLKAAGYATAHFGKWHLGAEPYDALHQGFDVDMPHTFHPAPMGGYLGPWSFWKGKGQPGEHIEDRMSREAAQFIQAHKDRPFYLNYWAFSVHSPWQAKKDLIEKYRGRTDPNNANRNPVYGAMVQSLDEGVGRLLQAIDDAGVANNTIIVFFSDNGGVFWEPGRGMMHAGYENIPPTSNAPLRAGKATLYEGGTREPCIVVWPGKVKPGSQSSEMISSVDFHPTLLEMTGAAPAGSGKFDGISFVPALAGKPIQREAIFCHFPHYTPMTGGKPGSYVHKGDWKLIRFWCDNEDQSDRFELYDLRKDIEEKTNLAERMPGKVKELNALLEGFLRDTKAVIPKPNPDYQRSTARRTLELQNPDDLA